MHVFIVHSGQKVGLRYIREPQTWLSCATTTCGKATCPKQFFLPNKQGCYGEIFRIYNQYGGDIRSGDVVALYYPHNNRWLGCSIPQNHCSNWRDCPGNWELMAQYLCKSYDNPWNILYHIRTYQPSDQGLVLAKGLDSIKNDNQ